MVHGGHCAGGRGRGRHLALLDPWFIVNTGPPDAFNRAGLKRSLLRNDSQRYWWVQVSLTVGHGHQVPTPTHPHQHAGPLPRGARPGCDPPPRARSPCAFLVANDGEACLSEACFPGETLGCHFLPFCSDIWREIHACRGSGWDGGAL